MWNTVVKLRWWLLRSIYNELGEVVHIARGTFFVVEERPLPDLPWRFIEEDDPNLI